ncbi:alpha-amylase family glycosyl hydrolase, partial [Streptomyces platensis]|uniref:alpha-amylase family glycosyl hydrolase n=1 Tax=Streptomyces platensis TaxID=58346 RepID=UPI003C2E7E04
MIYHVYPRSFLDTDGDGVGNLRGISHRIPYLVWLGVDALWLSPFFSSPMEDFGYDIRDHTAVDSLFGDMADFDALLDTAHDHGLRVLIDYVPHHTAASHAWSQESSSGPAVHGPPPPHGRIRQSATPLRPGPLRHPPALSRLPDIAPLLRPRAGRTHRPGRDPHEYDWPVWSSYFGRDLDEMHLPLNFGLLRTPWQTRATQDLVWPRFSGRCECHKATPPRTHSPNGRGRAGGAWCVDVKRSRAPNTPPPAR